MKISYTVVTHPERIEQAEKLSAQLGGPICLDDNQYGAGKNHDRALILANTEHDGDADWCIIIEDDATLVDGFHAQVELALTNCPANVASLYLGDGYPSTRRNRIRQILEDDPPWVMHSELRHNVCVAIKPYLITPLLGIVENITRLDADQRWGYGLRRLGQPVAYSNPSLVDHEDGLSVIGRRKDGLPRSRARKAFNAGTRNIWTSEYVTLR